jgi:hypothetical protein
MKADSVMSDKPVTFHRRNFLRGAAGVALALPWLESLAPANPVPSATPKRFLSVYHPDVSACRSSPIRRGMIGAGFRAAARKISN